MMECRMSSKDSRTVWSGEKDGDYVKILPIVIVQGLCGGVWEEYKQ